ncbi:alpha/beta hydrolase [Nocardioides sp. JQ2195]|uniref:alpha/beta hydrolase n=1 Tax=Nocardioides sp. JQ2195 TaxID=2592334 RepID=UPI00143E5AE6|nr:alpha/beta hydrolase [Nocardioides sp. JQ2195]QIX27228.1 alpha/beta hydrolase [Nocardioides sp. JQ2195]
MTYTFDIELQPWVSMLPILDVSDPVVARELLAQMSASIPPFEAPEGITITEAEVPGPDGEPDVSVVIFSPIGDESDRPVVVYAHGGGFVTGSAEGDLALPAQMAAATGAVVISVNYRLAPETQFPGPVEDCYAVLLWVEKNSESLGTDPARIAVAGVSAGACFAAAMTLMARDRNGPQVCFQMLDIPVLDDRCDTPSMHDYPDAPIWTPNSARDSWQHYLGAEASQDVPAYAAPARAQDLTGLPPAYVVVAEYDSLRDEGIDYARRLLAAGVPTELHLFPGTFHGSGGAIPDAAVSQRMRAEALSALKLGLRPAPASTTNLQP